MKRHHEILDNFKTHIAELQDPKQKVEEIIEFAIVYGDSYGDNIVPLLETGIEISKKINFDTGIVICVYNLLFFRGRTTGGSVQNYTDATIEEVSAMVEKIKHEPYWYSLGLNLLAYYYWFKNDYAMGFNIALQGVKYGEEVRDKNLGWHYFALGVFYFDTKDLENSALYHQKAFEAFESFGDQYGKARAGNGMATTAIAKNEIEKAAPLLHYAAEVYREFGHYSGLSRALNDMALIEKINKNYGKAIELLEESVELRKEINHTQGLITSLTELGEIYLDKEELEKALQLFSQALELSVQVQSKQKSMRLNKLLYDIYKKQNKTELALKHFEEFYALKTEVMGDEASNNIKRLQTNFEKEKSEKIAEVERLKNVELQKAYEIIAQKNKDIHDSINYASRIQRSLLPSDRNIKKMLEKLLAEKRQRQN